MPLVKVRGEQQLRICAAPRQLQQAHHFVLLNFVSKPEPNSRDQVSPKRPSYKASVPLVQLLAGLLQWLRLPRCGRCAQHALRRRPFGEGIGIGCTCLVTTPCRL